MLAVQFINTFVKKLQFHGADGTDYGSMICPLNARENKLISKNSIVQFMKFSGHFEVRFRLLPFFSEEKTKQNRKVHELIQKNADGICHCGL